MAGIVVDAEAALDVFAVAEGVEEGDGFGGVFDPEREVIYRGGPEQFSCGWIFSLPLASNLSGAVSKVLRSSTTALSLVLILIKTGVAKVDPLRYK